MLHTVAPLEAVFAGSGGIGAAREYSLGGVKTLVRFYGGAAYVERIISSDPNDYLVCAFPPGTYLGRIAEME